jgi:CubicO group peptidase (beta-lactamase class C family)
MLELLDEWTARRMRSGKQRTYHPGNTTTPRKIASESFVLLLVGRPIVFLMRRTSLQIKPLLSFAAVVLAPLIPLSNFDSSSRVDDYMKAQMKENRFSGSVLIVQSGNVLLTKGYGMADVELNVLNTPSTKFRLGSVTQQFTAMAILKLREEGRLDVQDLVCKYIQECPNDWQEIKIVNLLTHTSGISNFTDFPDYEKTMMLPTTVPELLARFKSKPLEFKPGEKVKYSNSGYEVLGVVIENVSGEPYAKYLADTIVPLTSSLSAPLVIGEMETWAPC